VVLGISADSPRAQKKFKDKYDLPFPLLADTEKKVSNAYGVIKEKTLYGKMFKGISRMSFLIGSDGKIRKVFDNVKPAGHAEEVLGAV
jgi:peroxiredoxin Q/BCP